MDVFYETLCPDSIKFLKEQLFPTYTTLKGIMNVQIFPYGNCNQTLSEEGLWQFQCQHKEKECRLNQVLCFPKYTYKNDFKKIEA